MKTRRARSSRRSRKAASSHKKRTTRRLNSQRRRPTQRGGSAIMAPANLFNVYGKKVTEVAVSQPMPGPDSVDF